MFVILLLLYSFIYLNFHQNFPGLSLFFLVSSFVILVTLWRKPEVPDNILIRPLFLFNLFVILSIPFSSYIKVSFEFYEYIFKIQLVAFSTYAILNSSKRIFYFIMVLVGYHMVLVKNTITGAMQTRDTFRHGASGLAQSSFMGDANDFALAINIMLPFVFYMIFYVKNVILKLLLAVVSVYFIIGIVISNSRGGFITLTAVVLFLIIQSKQKVVGIIAAMMVFVFLFAFAPDSYVDRIKTLKGSALEEGDTGYGRLTLWDAGVKMMLDNPLTGVGLARYQAAYGEKYHREGDRKWRVTHSSYIAVGAEAGVFALLFYLLLLYRIFKTNLRNREALLATGNENHVPFYLSKALTVSLLAYCVGSLALTVWYYIHIYLILFLTLAVQQAARVELGVTVIDDKKKEVLDH